MFLNRGEKGVSCQLNQASPQDLKRCQPGSCAIALDNV